MPLSSCVTLNNELSLVDNFVSAEVTFRLPVGDVITTDGKMLSEKIK